MKRVGALLRKCSLRRTVTVLVALVALLVAPAVAQAAIAQRGTATTGSSITTALTINKPAGVVAGDVMIVNIAQQGNNTTAPSLAGWTLIRGADLAGGTARYGAVLYRVANGSEGANFTFTLGAGTVGSAGAIVAFSGVDGTTPFDVASPAISVQGNQVGVSATTLTTVSNNTAVIMFGMAASASPTWSGWSVTSPGGLTELYDFQLATFATVGAGWAPKPTAGATGAGVATLSAAERNGGILVALRPGSSDTTAPVTATVTTPTNLGLYRAATVPEPFAGQAADNVGGSGIDTDAVRFTLANPSGQYWNGASFVAGVTRLEANNSGTTSGTAVTWSEDATLPTWSSATEGTYTVQAVVTDKSSNTTTGTAITFRLDRTAPTVTVNQAAGQLDPTNNPSIQFTVVFSEAASGVAIGDFTVGGTAPGSPHVDSVTGSGTTYTATVHGATGSGTVTLIMPAGGATDLAGNANTASTSTDNSVTYDNVAPTVTVNQAAGQLDPTNNPSIQFTVVFSEAASGVAIGDFTVGGTAPGAHVDSVSGSGTTYTVTVHGATGSGTVTLTMPAGGAADAAGNTNEASTSTDNSVTYNDVPPTVTVNQASGQVDPTNNPSIEFTVVFSESVTGVDIADFTVGGTAPGAHVDSVSGSGDTYAVTVHGATGSGTVTLIMPAGGAIDAASNPNEASTSTDNTVTYDNVAPTVTVNQASGQLDPTNNPSIEFTVVFSEAASGVAIGDFTVGGTAPGAHVDSVSGSGSTYTVTVHGATGSGTVTLTMPAGGATDLAGNANEASTSTDNSVTYDNVAPTVTVNQASGQADPTNNPSITFTVVFSESVTGVGAGDFTVGGTAPGAHVDSVSGSGTTYTVTVHGATGSGTVILTMPAGGASDGAANTNEASTSTDNTVTYDNVAPTVTVNQAAGQADPTNNPSIEFTVVFSESVTGVGAGDFTVGGTAPGAHVDSVSGSGTTYTVTVHGATGSGTVILTMPAGGASDGAGNTSAASTSTDNSVTYVTPLVILAPAPGTASGGSIVPVLFTVRNQTDVTMTLTLTPSCDAGWLTSIVGGAAQILSPHTDVVRTVNVTVPGSAAGSTLVRLSATGDGTATGMASLDVPSSAPRAGIPTVSWHVHRGRLFRVLGSLKPPHKALRRWVVLRFERKLEDGTWVFVKDSRAVSYAKGHGSPSNHYAVRTRLSTRGFYRVRAYHPAHGGEPATWSGYNWFYVR
jgi:hypothetical protein